MVAHILQFWLCFCLQIIHILQVNPAEWITIVQSVCKMIKDTLNVKSCCLHTVWVLQKRRNYQLHPEEVRPTTQCATYKWTQSILQLMIHCGEFHSVPGTAERKNNTKCQWKISACIVWLWSESDINLGTEAASFLVNFLEPFLLQHKRIQQISQGRERKNSMTIFSHAWTWEDRLHSKHFRAL